MILQAASGIAKDLNKMSAKTAIKQLVPSDESSTLFKWVALLTGSKNTLKGCGFFLGGFLLALFGYQNSLYLLATGLGLITLLVAFQLKQSLEAKSFKPKFSQVFSSSKKVNLLSFARCFLFASRDVWFVVALPVYLHTIFGWDFWKVGGFMASWIIGYGFIQTIAPRITGNMEGKQPAVLWAAALALIPAAIAIGLAAGWSPQFVIVGGLLLFGVLFAVNSSLHSYLIVSYARGDGVSLDVGFYYMSNAAGRLLGTILSGWVYQAWGLEACLWISSGLVAMAALLSVLLPQRRPVTA